MEIRRVFSFLSDFILGVFAIVILHAPGIEETLKLIGGIATVIMLILRCYIAYKDAQYVGMRARASKP